MKRTLAVAAMLVFGITASGSAQHADHAASKDLTNGIAGPYHMVKANISAAADQMPEDKYSFQATKDVRTFGQLIGHIADANNFFCGHFGGAANEYAVVAEKLTAKADLVAALKASFAACDAAIGKLTDGDLAKPLTIFGNKTNVAGAITFNGSHDWEHYGNIVTYLRLNGMVPPSSQQ
jgi:uncharacterized damage-inducible protein DinB